MCSFNKQPLSQQVFEVSHVHAFLFYTENVRTLIVDRFTKDIETAESALIS